MARDDDLAGTEGRIGRENRKPVVHGLHHGQSEGLAAGRAHRERGLVPLGREVGQRAHETDGVAQPVRVHEVLQACVLGPAADNAQPPLRVVRGHLGERVDQRVEALAGHELSRGGDQRQAAHRGVAGRRRHDVADAREQGRPVAQLSLVVVHIGPGEADDTVHLAVQLQRALAQLLGGHHRALVVDDHASVAVPSMGDEVRGERRPGSNHDIGTAPPEVTEDQVIDLLGVLVGPVVLSRHDPGRFAALGLRRRLAPVGQVAHGHVAGRLEGRPVRRTEDRDDLHLVVDRQRGGQAAGRPRHSAEVVDAVEQEGDPHKCPLGFSRSVRAAVSDARSPRARVRCPR